MTTLQRFMVVGYVTTGAMLCALAAIMPATPTTAVLVIAAGVCFWRARYWWLRG